MPTATSLATAPAPGYSEAMPSEATSLLAATQLPPDTVVMVSAPSGL